MSFRLTTAIYDGRRIPLSNDDLIDTKKENYYTILIGRNGTGKSRLLSEICRAFESLDSDMSQHQNRLRAGKKQDYSDKHLQLYYSNDQRKFHLYYSGKSTNCMPPKEGGEILNYFLCPPERVIATTITPSDKFPVGRRRFSPSTYNDDERSSIYRYLGSKNNVGQLSSTGQLSRVIESLM